ncbi:MAG: DUF3667 domain-containing protein [Sphingorhabdus sp.]
MTGEFDAAGTAIEGALLGMAVEGEKPGGHHSGDGDGSCLNCGAALSGAFCNRCGQKARIHRSFAAIWHDILHGVLHFDGKMWRTLPMLAFKPGQLTRRYVHGERAGFISPMALFLFSIFLMFAIFSFTGGSAASNTDRLAESQQISAMITALEKKTEALKLDVQNGTADKTELLEAREELVSAKQALNIVAKLENQALPYPDAGIGKDESDRIVSFDSDIKTGIKWLDDRLLSGAKKANSNPSLLIYKLRSNGYKFAWLLIPLSLPFVWLATMGAGGGLRVYHLYDHAVFTTYSIAFMSLLFLLCSLLARSGLSFAWFALVIVPPVHLYKQLKYAYQFNRLSTILRLVLLLAFIAIILALFFLTLLFLGILG